MLCHNPNSFQCNCQPATGTHHYRTKFCLYRFIRKCIYHRGGYVCLYLGCFRRWYNQFRCRNQFNFSYLDRIGSQTVSVRYTNSFGCTTATPTIYNVNVNNNLPVSVSIAPSANPVCAGTSVTYTATPTNGGSTPSYQWKVDGVNQGTNSPVFTFTPANGDVITCVLTSNLGCATGNPATSNAITMTVNPLLPVSVSIVASANPVCSGTSVTFTATPTNGGASPSYQWKVNGVNQGTNSPVYTYSPINGQTITCVLNIKCDLSYREPGHIKFDHHDGQPKCAGKRFHCCICKSGLFRNFCNIYRNPHQWRICTFLSMEGQRG